MKVYVWAERMSTYLEVPDECSEEVIWEIVRGEVLEQLEYGWYEIEENN